LILSQFSIITQPVDSNGPFAVTKGTLRVCGHEGFWWYYVHFPKYFWIRQAAVGYCFN